MRSDILGMKSMVSLYKTMLLGSLYNTDTPLYWKPVGNWTLKVIIMILERICGICVLDCILRLFGTLELDCGVCSFSL